MAIWIGVCVGGLWVEKNDCLTFIFQRLLLFILMEPHFPDHSRWCFGSHLCYYYFKFALLLALAEQNDRIASLYFISHFSYFFLTLPKLVLQSVNIKVNILHLKRIGYQTYACSYIFCKYLSLVSSLSPSVRPTISLSLSVSLSHSLARSLTHTNALTLTFVKSISWCHHA